MSTKNRKQDERKNCKLNEAIRSQITSVSFRFGVHRTIGKEVKQIEVKRRRIIGSFVALKNESEAKRSTFCFVSLGSETNS
jgi:hypothetical protein